MPTFGRNSATSTSTSGNYTAALQRGADLLEQGLDAAEATKGTGAGAGIATAVVGGVSGAASGMGTAVAIGAGLGTAAGPVGIAAGAVIGSIIGGGIALFNWWKSTHGEGAPPADPPELDLNHANMVAAAQRLKAIFDATGARAMFNVGGMYDRVARLAALPPSASLAEYLADPLIADMVARELERRGVRPDDPHLRAFQHRLLGMTPLTSLRRLSSAERALRNPAAMNAIMNPLAGVRKTATPYDMAKRASAAFRGGSRQGLAALAAPASSDSAGGQSTSGSLLKLASGAALVVGVWYFLR